MNKLIKAMMLLSSAVLMVGLSACGSPNPEPVETPKPIPAPIQVSEKYVNEHTFEVTKKLKDGRTVTCVAWQEYQEGGLSCDWESVVKPSK